MSHLLMPLADLDEVPLWAWPAFLVFVAAMLALDLGVLQREPHAVGLREAIGWCAVWGALAVGFGALIGWWRGREFAEQYYAGYLVELCLSVDNIFVFILVFAYFKVPPQWQHRVLFWGIVGAVLTRGAFILVGVGVIAHFHWVLYLFGAFLVYTGLKLALPRKSGNDVDPGKHFAVKLIRRCLPVTAEMDGGKFLTVDAGRRAATPLLLVLVVIETTDLVFAMDSLPAVLSITTDGFVALTSNIFAILGLRSLYFALNGVMQLFRYLRAGLATILAFIGVKMLIVHWVKISTTTSLMVIGAVLTLAIVLSILIKPPSHRESTR